jgi:hypothetical protein
MAITLTFSDGTSKQLGEYAHLTDYRKTEYSIGAQQKLVGLRSYSKWAIREWTENGNPVMSRYNILGYLGLVLLDSNCGSCPGTPTNFKAV